MHKAMGIIGREGRGVVVLIRRVAPRCNLGAAEGRRRRQGQQRLIEYGIGAQILLDLGVREMMLLDQLARAQDRRP